MSNRTKNLSQGTNVLFVPLGKLKKSPKNVRKVPHTKADITARRQHRRSAPCRPIRGLRQAAHRGREERQASAELKIET
jgi:hypothetical protein